MKKLLPMILVLLLLIAFTGCEQTEAKDMEYTLEFQGIIYSGKYSGAIKEKKPHGSGVFESNEGDNHLSYTGTWNEGAFSGEGHLNASQFLIIFPYVDRLGAFEGDVISGVPNGQGSFSAVNGDGDAYKYTGEFKDGIFNGAGQRIFEDEQFNEYGTFKNGDFSPTPAEHFANLGQNNTAKYTITSKAHDFLSEHEKLFTTGFKSGLDDYIDNEFKLEAYTKSPEKYGDKLFFASSLTITQIVEWGSFGNQPVTYILAGDSSYNIYYMHYLGTENVYVGDVINVYLLPLNHFTYESVSGNDIWAIACAVAYIEKA